MEEIFKVVKDGDHFSIISNTGEVIPILKMNQSSEENLDSWWKNVEKGGDVLKAITLITQWNLSSTFHQINKSRVLKDHEKEIEKEIEKHVLFQYIRELYLKYKSDIEIKQEILKDKKFENNKVPGKVLSHWKRYVGITKENDRLYSFSVYLRNNNYHLDYSDKNVKIYLEKHCGLNYKSKFIQDFKLLEMKIRTAFGLETIDSLRKAIQDYYIKYK